MMQTEKKLKAKPQRKTGKRILKLVLALAAVSIVVAFLLTPAFISSEKGRKIILAKINDFLDGQTDFASLSMSWRKGIKVTNIRFNDSAGRTSVALKQIAIKPRYLSILLGKLSFNAKLGFEQAGYMGLSFGPTTVDVQIRNGILKIEPFSTTVNNGQFNFSGEADFSRKPAILKTDRPIQIIENIQINDEISRELLVYINPVFANAFNVSGVGNFNCERLALPLAGAPREKLEIIGTIWADDIRLSVSDLLSQILTLAGLSFRDQNIKVHPTRFVLTDGFLRYDDMQVDVGDNPVNFGGVIGLDKSLNMTITLPYTLKGETARVGKETVGQRISLPLTGTIDRPELDIGKLLELQLKQQLERRLREKLLEGLDKLLK